MTCRRTGNGTSTPTPCGGDEVYCPAQSAVPLPVSSGYYSTGVPGFRSGRNVCPVGQFCPGDGRIYDCPSGRYGNATGLLTADCSGECSDGVLCVARTTNATGAVCPVGSYCVRGLLVPCAPGSYNPATGGTSQGSCLLCPANTFVSTNGSSSVSSCSACPAFEGSDPGASTCWPGVKGTVKLPFSRGA